MSVKPIPEGYHTVTPYIVVKPAREVIEFLKTAFAAEVTCISEGKDGTIMNAEIKIGTSMVMIAQARDGMPTSPASLYLYVNDTDAWYKKAIEAGAESIMEPADQFYGDRNAGVKDMAGNQWWLATHIEDVTPQEIERRAENASR